MDQYRIEPLHVEALDDAPVGASVRPRRPAVVWGALVALSLTSLGLLFVLAIRVRGIAAELGSRALYCGSEQDDSACIDRVNQGIAESAVLAGVVAVPLVLAALATVLVARGRGTGRGIAWVAVAFSLAPHAWTIHIATHYHGPPRTLELNVDLTGVVVALVGSVVAAGLLTTPAARRYFIDRWSDGSGGDRRPRALTVTVVAALLGAVGQAVATAAYGALALFPRAPLQPDVTIPSSFWVFVGMVSLLMTALAVLVVSASLAARGRRPWASRTTAVLAVVVLAVGTTGGFLSGGVGWLVGAYVSGARSAYQVELNLLAAAGVGGLLTLVGLGVATVALSSSSVTAWVAARGRTLAGP
ncbi:MAG TPA: hypothetical protein VGR21_10250, partial [Cryptosporangiaceae bacterium]|nr:hypothetical protein [Cryptosporangiaceae bacterium]